MSPDTDHPRQRTVAELLAQHGGGDTATTGRRRRRREAGDAPDEPGRPGPDTGAPAGWSPRAPEPAPRDRTGWDLPQQFSPPPSGGPQFGGPPPVTGQWGAPS